MELYLTGGRARPDANRRVEWDRFDQAVLLKLDTDKRTCEKVLTYTSPPEVVPDEANSVVFKAGHREDDKLYLCTQTEVLTYSLPQFEQIGYLTHPWFNDVHHAVPSSRGTLFVTVTGLDLIVEYSLDGEPLKDWATLGADTWARFSKDIDYRKVPTTKPHPSHPNLVFFWKDEIFATRHFQDDAVSLNDLSRTMEIGTGHPHDGEVVGDRVYFTTVNGFLVETDLATGKRIAAHDLNKIYDEKRPLGWCRGLKVLDDDVILVGFSRLRKTKSAEYVNWIKNTVKAAVKTGEQSGNALPTRVAAINTKTETVEWQVELEDHDMHALFSIL